MVDGRDALFDQASVEKATVHDSCVQNFIQSSKENAACPVTSLRVTQDGLRSHQYLLISSADSPIWRSLFSGHCDPRQNQLLLILPATHPCSRRDSPPLHSCPPQHRELHPLARRYWQPPVQRPTVSQSSPHSSAPSPSLQPVSSSPVHPCLVPCTPAPAAGPHSAHSAKAPADGSGLPPPPNSCV